MAWKKINTQAGLVYVVSEYTEQYHYLKDISLQSLNNANEEFDLSNKNPQYAVEFRKDKEEPLPAGVYSLKAEDIFDDPKLYPIEPAHDTFLFELDVVKDVLKDFRSFLNAKETYHKIGLMHKRGVLLYGPPGTGKTSAIQMIINTIRPPDSLVIYITKEIPANFINELKKESRLKILIFEELVGSIERGSNQSRLLTFLDGENSADNTYILATTNYPENLPGNILREGRFDELYRIDFLLEKDRRQYIKHLVGRSPTPQELEITKGMSIAAIKTLFLLVIKDGLTSGAAFDKIKKHQNVVKKNFQKSKTLGFDPDAD